MKDRKSSGKKRYLLLGAAAGLLLSLGVQTYAQDALTSITAWLRNDYRIEYNGEEQTLPEGYDILVYQDRTYLPLRYVGELVGAEIEWNPETHTASIRREESADTPETPDISDTIDTTGYGTLAPEHRDIGLPDHRHGTDGEKKKTTAKGRVCISV